MNKEKQIEEMANFLFDLSGTDDIYYIAKRLYEAGYRKQSEWISVDERLPELYTSVLVYCDAMVSKFYCVSEMIEPYGKRWSAVCGFRVTHWMPLPEAPRKEDEGK